MDRLAEASNYAKAKVILILMGLASLAQSYGYVGMGDAKGF